MAEDPSGSQLNGPLKPPTPSPVTTPPGSAAPAATEIPPRHLPLAFVVFIAGTTWPQASGAEPLAEANERFGGGAGAAVLFALLADEQQHPGAAGGVVDGALAAGGGGGGGALAFPVEERGAEGQVAAAGGG